MFASWLLAFCFGAISLGNWMQVDSLQLVNHRVKVVHRWKYIDYLYDSVKQQKALLQSGGYIAKNNIPIDVDVSKDGRIFVTVIRDKGVPATLGVVSTKYGAGGPLLKPYPDWSWTRTDCYGIISVYRVEICDNTLYVLDNGKIGNDVVCPPKLLAFDLTTDRLIKNLTIPANVATNSTTGQGLLITPIIKPYDHPVPFEAILADAEGYALVTYSPQTGWNRVTSGALNYDPNVVTYTINGQSFQLNDGPLGMDLSQKTNTLYLSPMSSLNMVSVNSIELTHALNNAVQFRVYKDILPTQSSAKAMSRSGILFLGLMDNSIACWNENLPLTKDNMIAVIHSTELIQFASGMKVKDSGSFWFYEEDLWVMTNRYQKAATNTLNTTEINFRILKGNVRELTAGTRCQQRTF